MALGKRKHQQQEAWVATTALPKSPGHPFQEKLNQLLAYSGFDAWMRSLMPEQIVQYSRSACAFSSRLR